MQAAIEDEVLKLSTDEISSRGRLLENDIKVRGTSSLRPPPQTLTPCRCTSLQIMKSETSRISHEQSTMKEKIKENADKIKVFKVLPYLVSNVVEVCMC